MNEGIKNGHSRGNKAREGEVRRTNALTAKMPGKRSRLLARTVWSTWKCITKKRSGGLLFSP